MSIEFVKKKNFFAPCRNCKIMRLKKSTDYAARPKAATKKNVTTDYADYTD